MGCTTPALGGRLRFSERVCLSWLLRLATSLWTDASARSASLLEDAAASEGGGSSSS